MSSNLAFSILTPFLSLIRPSSTKNFKKRPCSAGLFDTYTVAPLGRSFKLLYFFEYTAIGSNSTFPADSILYPFSLLSVFKYGVCWKKFASISPLSNNLLGVV